MQPPFSPGAPPGPGGFTPPPAGYMPPGGYIPPIGSPGPSGPDFARSQVAGPAIGLLITTGLAFFWYLAVTVLVLFAGGMGFMTSPSSGTDPIGAALGGVIAAAVYGFFALVAGVAFVGALKMKSLKSYGFAMTSAILSLLPCTTYMCCVVTMPFGIWALITLTKPEVKAAFS
jgi:hypothetical protein